MSGGEPLKTWKREDIVKAIETLEKGIVSMEYLIDENRNFITELEDELKIRDFIQKKENQQ